MSGRVVFGDCRASMIDMIGQGERVQMCVTSPPYFGLRDYGHAGQIGLESTPAEYVARMVEVFSLVWYLLADDGVLWLNLGDSYGRGARTENPSDSKRGTGFHEAITKDDGYGAPVLARALPNKQLLGIPWRVAFALQEAGWYLRQDIIWHKPNPMPESVTDRCTKAHEYLFLLTKRERYYFDAGAIKEPMADSSKARLCRADLRQKEGWADAYHGNPPNGLARERPTGPRFGGDKYGDDVREESRTKSGNEYTGGDGKANRRSVWTVATKPYKGAHFATFPPALIEPCILAGSRPGDTVFDPFMGSGTTAQVAKQHGRNWLGCELNPEYETLQQQRIQS